MQTQWVDALEEVREIATGIVGECIQILLDLQRSKVIDNHKHGVIHRLRTNRVTFKRCDIVGGGTTNKLHDHIDLLNVCEFD